MTSVSASIHGIIESTVSLKVIIQPHSKSRSESPRGEVVYCHGDAVLLDGSRSNCENDSESRPQSVGE